MSPIHQFTAQMLRLGQAKAHHGLRPRTWNPASGTPLQLAENKWLEHLSNYGCLLESRNWTLATLLWDKGISVARLNTHSVLISHVLCPACWLVERGHYGSQSELLLLFQYFVGWPHLRPPELVFLSSLPNINVHHFTTLFVKSLLFRTGEYNLITSLNFLCLMCCIVIQLQALDRWKTSSAYSFI